MGQAGDKQGTSRGQAEASYRAMRPVHEQVISCAGHLIPSLCPLPGWQMGAEAGAVQELYGARQRNAADPEPRRILGIAPLYAPARLVVGGNRYGL